MQSAFHLRPRAKAASGAAGLRISPQAAAKIPAAAGPDVLLVRHNYDPVPLRDLFAARSFASWAEERSPHDWYIYFYRPSAGAAADGAALKRKTACLMRRVRAAEAGRRALRDLWCRVDEIETEATQPLPA